jgi:hypothetical protein
MSVVGLALQEYICTCNKWIWRPEVYKAAENAFEEYVYPIEIHPPHFCMLFYSMYHTLTVLLANHKDRNTATWRILQQMFGRQNILIVQVSTGVTHVNWQDMNKSSVIGLYSDFIEKPYAA